MYIKASNYEPNDYIGGKLYDLPETYWDDEDDELRIERYEEQKSYINTFANNYIIYCPQSDYEFELSISDRQLLYDLTERMAIKDGIDVIAYADHIEVVAYYNNYSEIAYLYPISQSKTDELIQLIQDADFDEDVVIENEIAQCTWNGASVEDVLKTWA